MTSQACELAAVPVRLPMNNSSTWAPIDPNALQTRRHRSPAPPVDNQIVTRFRYSACPPTRDRQTFRSSDLDVRAQLDGGIGRNVKEVRCGPDISPHQGEQSLLPQEHAPRPGHAHVIVRCEVDEVIQLLG